MGEADVDKIEPTNEPERQYVEEVEDYTPETEETTPSTVPSPMRANSNGGNEADGDSDASLETELKQESESNRTRWQKENRRAWQKKWEELKLNSMFLTPESRDQFLDSNQPHSESKLRTQVFII